MKIIISIAITLIAFPFAASSKASSVSLSTDSIEYEGHNLTGQSFAFNTDLNNHYGYEVSLQHINPYIINDHQGKISIRNELEINNIGLGLYRVLDFGKFHIRPIVGFIHTSVNLHTKFRYQDELKGFGETLPIDVSYDTYNTKTAIVPSYGVRISYDITKNINVFTDFRKQGYNLNQIGIEVTF